MFKTTRIPFQSVVFAALAVVDAKAPYLRLQWYFHLVLLDCLVRGSSF